MWQCNTYCPGKSAKRERIVKYPGMLTVHACCELQALAVVPCGLGQVYEPLFCWLQARVRVRLLEYVTVQTWVAAQLLPWLGLGHARPELPWVQTSVSVRVAGMANVSHHTHGGGMAEQRAQVSGLRGSTKHLLPGVVAAWLFGANTESIWKGLT